MFSNTSTAQRVPTRLHALAILVTAAVLTGSSVPASADEHSDRFSCYAYVHDQCFQNGQDGCGDDVYQDFLDECDRYYPSGRNTGGLVTPGGSSHPNMTIRR